MIANISWDESRATVLSNFEVLDRTPVLISLFAIAKLRQCD